MVAGAAAPGFYDAALLRRQALMGASGPAALIKNGRVFAIAMFACIGGLLYGKSHLPSQTHISANVVQVTTKEYFQAF